MEEMSLFPPRPLFRRTVMSGACGNGRHDMCLAWRCACRCHCPEDHNHE